MPLCHMPVVVLRYLAVALPRYCAIVGGMARGLPAEGRWVAVTVSLRQEHVDRLDKVRGGLNRSEWIRPVVLAALEDADDAADADAAWAEAGDPVPLAEVPAPRRRRKPAKAPEVLPLAEPAESPRRCPHPGKRSVGGYCNECDHLIKPGGYWA